ncbi:hypothetical protein CARUB_v10024129mg [Capsella rubella]|uniref:Mal d 1-associated protein n=1 Tax=Capsella rubella TaxID=81985 RepID=R0HRN3_9BRAS|nr:uncharacterized protein LOC17888341 [Capsella rubella]EOA27960.1 hypothetical protein CARUB_v10024129mg [Capsella rubella]
MGWVWVDDSSASKAGNDLTDQPLGDSAVADRNCSTTTVVRSQCNTEEVEPGKFVRKCDKTEEVLRHCLGKPSEVVQSNTVHTEEDVTNQMVGRPGLFEEKNPLNFPGLRGDVDAIERHFMSGMKSFFDAAEEMTSSLFDIMGDHNPSNRRGIPIENHPKVEEHHNDENAPRRPHSGEVDLSGLAKDV